LLPAIDRELRKIEKERFYRISDWVRGHPILALIVAGVSSVALNVAASIIFEKAKRILPWLG
jgi:hypothetical protein